jgi:DNA-binding MarR family transcriptional regulator
MAGRVPKRQNTVKSTDAGARALRDLVVDVFRLNGMLIAAGDALAAPAGQTSARWRVLAAVEDSPLTVSEIARSWSLARQSVQRVADLLQRAGLVAYEDNPAHRRASLVRLTPEGRSALRRIQASQREWAAAVGEQVGAADLDAASRILRRVQDALQEVGTGG